MLFLYVIMYLMRWCAVYLLGAQVGCLVTGATSVSESLIVFVVIIPMWLIGKGIDWMLGHPNPPKFLNTKTKMIIAIIISFAIGFITMLDAAGA